MFPFTRTFGTARSQTIFSSVCGTSSQPFCNFANRNAGRVVICPTCPPRRSRARGESPQRGTAMLLWPEQSQTSPTRTSRTTRSFTLRSRPSDEAASGFRSTRQRPSAPTVVVRSCPSNATRTASPAAPVPQTGTRTSRWRTAPSVNGAARRIAAKVREANIMEFSSFYFCRTAPKSRRRTLSGGISSTATPSANAQVAPVTRSAADARPERSVTRFACPTDELNTVA